MFYFLRERKQNIYYQLESMTAGVRDARLEGPIDQDVMNEKLELVKITESDPEQVCVFY